MNVSVIPAAPAEGQNNVNGLAEVLGCPADQCQAAPDQQAALAGILRELYAPVGIRQKIMLTSSAPGALVELARELVQTADRHPDREVCLLHPRIGETRVRAEDISDFLTKYGHEIAIAYFDAAELGVSPADIDLVSAAAHSEQVLIGWDLTGLAADAAWSSGAPAPVDFAIRDNPAEVFRRPAAEPAPAGEVVTAALLRSVMGRFVTGVGMVSAWHEGEFFAAPVNSLTAVSLDPPLILVCFQHHSRTGRAVVNSGDWAVSILGHHQIELSQRLAKSQPESAGPAENRIAGVPVLPDAIGRIRCRTEKLITAGDHVVVLGRVLHAEHSDGEPLVFYSGAYHRLPQPE